MPQCAKKRKQTYQQRPCAQNSLPIKFSQATPQDIKTPLVFIARACDKNSFQNLVLKTGITTRRTHMFKYSLLAVALMFVAVACNKKEEAAPVEAAPVETVPAEVAPMDAAPADAAPAPEAAPADAAPAPEAAPAQ
jgi:hypothetical protein